MLFRSRNVSFKPLSRPRPPYSLRNPFPAHLSRSHASPMLTSRITLPAPRAPSQEDVFSSALSTLFTDDTQNSHGSPGGSLTYASPAFGDITLQIPAHPVVEERRNLFAHYLWNASLVAAEGIERASAEETEAGREKGKGDSDGREQWNLRWWNVRGKRVLELGAGMSSRGPAYLSP